MADVAAGVFHPDRVEQAYRDQVARLHQRLAHAHRAGEVAAVVLRSPHVAAAILEHHRGVQHDRGRVEAALEGRSVDERLEAGAWLAARLGGAVELVAGEAETADQRADRAVVGIQRDQCRLAARQLVDRPLRGGVGLVGREPAHPHHVAALGQSRRRLAGPGERAAAQGEFAAVGQHDAQLATLAAGHHGRQQTALRRRAAQQAGDRRGVRTGRDIDLLLRLAPAMAVVVDPQAVDHRLVGCALQHRVDGGGDVVALAEHVAAEAFDHLLAHHFRHVRRIHLDLALVRAGVHRHRAGGVGLGPAHVAQFGHARQDVVVAADPGALRVAQRVAAGRELGDAGQGGGLVQGQLVQGLAVVELGRCGHAVGAIAEKALVEVQLEDLVLAEFALHLHRQQHLGELAAEAVFGAQEELLGHLLGDGRATGHALLPAGLGQQPHGAGHAVDVDAVVFVEIGVLGGQEGLLHPRRNLGDVDRIAAHFPEQAHQPAVGRIHVERFLQLGVAQALHVGQARADDVDQDADRQHPDQAKCDRAQQKPAQHAGEAGHWGEFRLQPGRARSIE